MRTPGSTHVQVYCILVALDIEQFSHPQRDDQVRVQLRRALYDGVAQALRSGGVLPGQWLASGIGDGLLLLADPTAETARVIWSLLDRLRSEIEQYNRLRVGPAVLRTRVVLHTGHIMLDQLGAAGEQVIRVFRLLDAEALRARLRQTKAPVVVAVSDEVYREVVRQRALGLDPADFQPLHVEVKETRGHAWVYRSGGVDRDLDGRKAGR